MRQVSLNYFFFFFFIYYNFEFHYFKRGVLIQDIIKHFPHSVQYISFKEPNTCAIARIYNFSLRTLSNFFSGKGITATMGRNGFFNMIYFGFYHSVKNYFPAADDRRLGKLILKKADLTELFLFYMIMPSTTQSRTTFLLPMTKGLVSVL